MTNPQDPRIEFQRKILGFGVWSSCINCKFWRPNAVGASSQITEDCVKFNVRPPTSVIVLSCPAWIHQVPF